MANRNWANAGRLFAMKVKPVWLDANFTVDATNGLGITGLTGGAIANVFMHTSTTPAVGNFGVTNPNPASGIIAVQFTDNYSGYYGGFSIARPPQSGSDIKIDNSAMTAGSLYVITTLGNATLAKWVAIGVPVGITPAVGVAFIASGTGGTGNTLTSRVQLPATAGSGITSIERIGSAGTMIAPAPSLATPGTGGFMYFQCYSQTFTAGAYTPTGTISRGNIPVTAGTAGDAVTNNAGALNSTGGQDLTVDLQTFTGAAASLTGTATNVLTAPAAGSKLSLHFLLSDSSVTIGGE